MRYALLFLLAACLPAAAGSITVTYKNDAGTTLYTPSATISNVDAATFVAWCQRHYAGNPLSVTAQGCFNVWADDVFNQLRLSVNTDAAATAAANAAAGAATITVTPGQ